jgi:DNA-directed RNA polymerase beta subunit
MEAQAFQVHGASQYLVDKFTKDSDGDLTHVCSKCRTFTKVMCPEHLDAHLDIVYVPQAMRLLVSELRGMNVHCRIMV